MIDLFQPGAYWRTAGGNTENASDQAPVTKWASWSINPDNGMNGNPRAWDISRAHWTAVGMEHFPWLHCRSIADVERLLSVAATYDSPAIGLNIEDIVGDGFTLAQVANTIRIWTRPVHMPTLPWVQNGQGWTQVRSAVCALEINPDENAESNQIQACIEHALDEGLTQITLMFKTKGFTPSSYGQFWPICHSLYTGDDITPSASSWSQWLAPEPCKKMEPNVPPVPPKQWYEKPYLTGTPVGPDKLPRSLYPPSADKGTFTGDDAMAYKRGISRAGRLKPWSPSTWNYTYGESFAMGKGGGDVVTSGVRGFQRQTWPQDKSMQTGNMGDKTYQAMRRARVSDPDSPHFKEPIFDSEAIRLLKAASEDAFEDEKVRAFRRNLADFCVRSENADSSAWTYTQARPFSGMGVAPERDHDNDCSGYVILAYFWARGKAGLAVPDPSGYAYDGFGSTWDDLDGHPKVLNGSYLVGDLAHYSGHVTICRKAGDKDTSVWSSFGSEPRPRGLSLHYRPDFLGVVRPPLE